MKHGLNQIFWVALFALPAVASAGQTQAPPPAQARPAPPSPFIGTGPTSEADIARLRAALLKLHGVEFLEITTKGEKIKVLIRVEIGGSLVSAAAKSAGFALRPMPRRSYFASGLSGTDTALLQTALGKVEGVERVEASGPVSGAMVRVLGDVKAVTLADAAKSAGFELRRISSYVASGPSASASIKRLRQSLEKVAGVSQLEMREVAGGATLRIQGAMEDEALTAAAKSAGFGLLPLSDLVGGQFRLERELDAGAEEKLQQALQGVAGIGAIQIDKTSEGARLSIKGGTAIPEVIVAGAKTAGFYLRQEEAETSSPDVEQDTPPAAGDRILEDLTKVGELAPDFTLLTQDGKSKMSLSDSRGKKPVVLIFGSYT